MRGFTIVELMLTILIMAILLAAGIPSFTSMIRTMRIKNASFDVYSSMMAARSEAISRNSTVTITPLSGTTNWAAGWNIVATTASGNVTVKSQSALPNITMSGPATVIYNSSGRLDPATATTCPAASPTSVCVSLSAANATAQDNRCVTLNLSGRPVTTKGNCP